MYSVKNVVERLGNAEHEYGAVRFLMSIYAIRKALRGSRYRLAPLPKRFQRIPCLSLSIESQMNTGRPTI